MADTAVIVDHDLFQHYDFGPHHPLRPERIAAGLDLLQSAGLWDPVTQRTEAPDSPHEELRLVHAAAYIDAVTVAGWGGSHHAPQFGISGGDNPPFLHMHESAARVAGGTVYAARAIMEGAVEHAFNPAGGLHHALRARASGFCIYNDPAVAAAVVASELGARVFYVDFDAHHGDGVQWLFYRDPHVFTLSFHETGRFLFPGTGSTEECGEGPGRGYSANIPTAPYTHDASWIELITTVLPPLIERFKPDLLISNHGCDTHLWDPITHMSLTTSSFVAQARLSHELAHAFAGGRWVAVGSGGYDWRRVVPRSWAILWAEMTGAVLPPSLPPAWTERWDSREREPLPSTFLDEDLSLHSLARAHEITSENRETVQALWRNLPRV